MTEPRLIRDMSVERRDDLIAQVWAFLSDRGYTITAPGLVSLETRLADMTREARLSREATEKAVRRENRLRDRIAYLHDVYAVSSNEPRCCSDCAANDISAELRLALRETGDVDA